ncbi:MAG: hypothetical protein JRN21_05230 [Nitrososphaerota archaeon]|nr:hypothetical protein [Nitrososphaerota archaeon]
MAKARRARTEALTLLLLLLMGSGALVAAGPAWAKTYRLTVQTNSPSYYGSQQVVVVGSVLPAPGAGTSVSISVYNPQGELARAAEAQVDGTTGNYTVSFAAGGASWTDGQYAVDATWAPSTSGPAYHATTTFSYSVNETTTTTASTTTTSTGAPAISATAASTTPTGSAASTTSSAGSTTSSAPVTVTAVVSSSGSVNVTVNDAVGGIALEVTGASSIEGKGLTLTVAVLQPPSPGTPAQVSLAGTSPLAFSSLVGVVDLRSNSSSAGELRFCVTSVGVDAQTEILYWNGAGWVQASGTTASGTTVCGTIPLSALGGTPVAIGSLAAAASSGTATSSHSGQPSSAAGGTSQPGLGSLLTGYGFYVLAAVAVAVAVLLAAVFAIRRRRRWWS